MPAILFGSISTIADTSELQRQAFNEAFDEHGLGWHWGREDYLDMLRHSGGRDRIAACARSLDQSIDTDAVHRTKSDRFRRLMAEAEVAPRDGVAETIRAAKADGIRVALVTTTSRENVSALIGALDGHLDDVDFDLILDSSSVPTPKPDGAAYSAALERLGQEPGGCVAVEDNLGGVAAARAAGITCVAFPNANTVGHDFDTMRIDSVDFASLRNLIPGE